MNALPDDRVALRHLRYPSRPESSGHASRAMTAKIVPVPPIGIARMALAGWLFRHRMY